jgi:hypothetical protein
MGLNGFHSLFLERVTFVSLPFRDRITHSYVRQYSNCDKMSLLALAMSCKYALLARKSGEGGLFF